MIRAFLRFSVLLISISAHAGVPLDIVFDIDQTIATLVHEGPSGDLLADPTDPLRGTVQISFDKPEYDSINRPLLNPNGTAITHPMTERYRVYDGFLDLMEKLRKLQEAGQVRVSFFSGGTPQRNKVLLSALKLSDGKSVLEMVTESSSSPRVYSREQMTYTGLAEGRVRDRFKKDLRLVNPNLEDVILIDDIQNFALGDQKLQTIWLGEDFPYPEKVNNPPLPKDLNPRLLEIERTKYDWLSERLLQFIDKRFSSGIPLSKIVQESNVYGHPSPFSHRRCSPKDVFSILNQLVGP